MRDSWALTYCTALCPLHASSPRREGPPTRRCPSPNTHQQLDQLINSSYRYLCTVSLPSQLSSTRRKIGHVVLMKARVAIDNGGWVSGLTLVPCSLAKETSVELSQVSGLRVAREPRSLIIEKKKHTKKRIFTFIIHL